MIDDRSEPGSWADALRFVPFIADERDGTIFRNWRPTAPLKSALHLFEGGADRNASAFARVSTFHADGDARACP